jgi:hypothetical protein
MACPSFESLVSYVAGDIDPAARERVGRHLASGCERCRGEVDAIADLRRLAAQTPPAVPRDVRRRALGALGGDAWRRLVDQVGRAAELVVDTRREPAAAGARRAAPAARQLLFTGFGYDVTVRVVSVRSGALRLAGHVLPGPGRPPESAAGLEVALERGGRPLALGRTNDLGEFAFEGLEAGAYTIYVDLSEGFLVLPDVDASAE